MGVAPLADDEGEVAQGSDLGLGVPLDVERTSEGFDDDRVLGRPGQGFGGWLDLTMGVRCRQGCQSAHKPFRDGLFLGLARSSTAVFGLSRGSSRS